MKKQRKLRLTALLLVLLLLFPAFAAGEETEDTGDTSTEQTEQVDQTEQTTQTTQTTQVGGTDTIDPSADKPRVFDYEQVLTEAQIDTLETKTKAIAEQYGCGVGIITIDDCAPYQDSAYNAAEQLYNELDLGASEDGDGIALLLSMNTRDYALYAHGDKAERIFSDAVMQDIEPYFLDNFGEDDWYGGFSDFVSGCEWYLQHVAEGGEVGVPAHSEVEIPEDTPTDIGTQSGQSRSFGSALGLAALISCAIALVVCLVFRAQMKSVRTQTTANRYVGEGGLKLTLSRDIYRYTSQQRRQIPRNDGNGRPPAGGAGHGGGFSGGVSHTSSGGHGRSGKF